MRIPVTRNFDNNDVIGYLELQDDVQVPLDTVFSFSYLGNGKIQSISLIPDENYLEFLKNRKPRKKVKEQVSNEQGDVLTRMIYGITRMKLIRVEIYGSSKYECLFCDGEPVALEEFFKHEDDCLYMFARQFQRMKNNEAKKDE